MKKIVKNVNLLLIMGVVLFLLAGCGANKLVATKTTEDEHMGTYKEQITVTFKNNKASSLEMVMEFDKEETAESMYNLYNLGMSMSENESTSGMNVKKDGKKLIITADAKAFLSSENASDENLTKDAIKASFEEQGYKVK